MNLETRLDALTRPTPEVANWQILRAGIQNIWEYEDQRFVFYKGRLLLRGQNASGKTKALEVLLPFLFDASLQPSRLDPFGSTSRPMRWNLFNEETPADRTVNIGYVWLELGRQDGEGPVYCTIGAGLRARRSASEVEVWYFKTSQRVDDDLSLLDERRVPLERPALAKAIGAHGQVFERGAAYRQAVNDDIFGLPEDQYGTLIDALLQLRRPQLSKQLDPGELSRILTASLPPLDEGTIGTLAEGFERLDRHRDERDELVRVHRELTRFLKVYERYVASFLKQKALALTQAESAFHEARRRLRELEEGRERLEALLRKQEEELEALRQEAERQGKRAETLRSSEAYQAIQELDRVERDAGAAKARAERAGSLWRRADEEAKTAAERANHAEARWKEQAPHAERARVRARQAAEEAALGEQHLAIDRLWEQGNLQAAEGLGESLKREREKALDRLRALDGAVRQAEAALERAEGQRKEAEGDAQERRLHLDRAEAEEAAAKDAFYEAVEAWAETLHVIAWPADGAELTPEACADLAAEVERAARVALTVEGERLARRRREREGALAEKRALLAEVEASSHRPPMPPEWRSERREREGASLYQLCDFVPGLDEEARARVEGALEAAGLLDAWVFPDGRFFDPGISDGLLRAGAHPARSLRDVLVPEAGPVPREVIEGILGSIEWVEEGEGAGACWIASDGRFRMGALEGRHVKAEAAFIGATARERARRRKMEEIRAEILVLEGELEACAEQERAHRERLEALEAERKSFPSLLPLQTCRNAVSLAHERWKEAEKKLHAAKEEHGRRAAAARDAWTARNVAADELGLRGWAERVGELAQRTQAYRELSLQAARQVERLAHGKAQLEDRRGDAQGARARADELRAEVERADAVARETQTRLEALRTAMGSTKEELLSEIRQAEEGKARAEEEQEALRKERELRIGEQATLRSQLEQVVELEKEAEARRKDAERAFRELASRGQLAHLKLEESPRPPEEWSYTDALVEARRVDEATRNIDPSPEARDRLENQVMARQQDLNQAMGAELRIFPQRVDDLLLYRAQRNGRTTGLLEQGAELASDIEKRDARLGEEEHGLFESFLSGETHDHLRSRLRGARTLVDRMSGQLEARPASSGMRMRLRWLPSDDAPHGVKEAIELLFREGRLLSEADREALRQFLRQRLDLARAGDGAGSLHERMMQVLDYRGWFNFHVEVQEGGRPWKRLTRKAHGAGSGGQKALMLHLPLFAAAAAFYESAAPHSLRVILLDEAFAGIDKPTRGKLMGLLVDFGLDFLMTSYEEWGFYPELDGLSTYQLSRAQGLPGVYAEWFLWDGSEATQVAA